MMERRREGWRGGGRNRRSRGREPIRINTVDLAERPCQLCRIVHP